MIPTNIREGVASARDLVGSAIERAAASWIAEPTRPARPVPWLPVIVA